MTGGLNIYNVVQNTRVNLSLGEWNSRLHKQSLGEWNSRLHKQSPPTRTKRKLMFLTRLGGFRLCRRGF
jgi:hypothetical protein